MSLSITSITFQDKYLDVVLEGASVGYSRQYLVIHDAAFAAAEEHGCQKILIDASRVQYTPNVILEHETAEDLARRCQGGCHVAVMSPAQSQNANKHLKNTARNRGVSMEVSSIVRRRSGFLS
jgi:hypothetical protein